MNRTAMLAAGVGGAVVVLLALGARTPRDETPASAVPDAMADVAPVARCRTTRPQLPVRAEGIAAICDDVYAETGLDATFIASEPPCTAASAAAARVDVTTLATNTAWQHHLDDTGRVHETYCAARAKVETWMQRFDSDAMRAEALRMLMTSVKRGTPFDTAFASY